VLTMLSEAKGCVNKRAVRMASRLTALVLGLALLGEGQGALADVLGP
jgi:hypothetical protein